MSSRGGPATAGTGGAGGTGRARIRRVEETVQVHAGVGGAARGEVEAERMAAVVAGSESGGSAADGRRLWEVRVASQSQRGGEGVGSWEAA